MTSTLPERLALDRLGEERDRSCHREEHLGSWHLDAVDIDVEQPPVNGKRPRSVGARLDDASGDLLAEALAERHLTQAELSRRIGLSGHHVNQIVHGFSPITIRSALLLEAELRMNAVFWLRCQLDCYLSLARTAGLLPEAARQNPGETPRAGEVRDPC